MKRLLPVIVAVLAGLLCMAAFLLQRAWRELDERNTEVAHLKTEKEQSRSKASFSKTAGSSPTSASKSDADPAPNEPAEKTEKKEDVNDLLMGAGAKDIASRSKARLELLRSRLKLRPEQMAELEKAAASRVAALKEAFERIRQNKGQPPDLGVVVDWMMGRFDVPVKSLLDADQAADYAGFETEERTSRIEDYVNVEMLELQGQGALHLTAEQKDQVFAALSGIVAEEDALGEAYYADDGRFMARIDDSLNRRRDVLKAILDGGQFENYDRVLAEDRTQIEAIFGGRSPAK